MRGREPKSAPSLTPGEGTGLENTLGGLRFLCELGVLCEMLFRNFYLLVAIRFEREDAALGVVLNFGDFHRSQMRDAA